MPKYAITIESVDDSFYWDSDYWESEICEDFEENVVVLGYDSSIEKASWWKDAQEIVRDFNYASDLDDFIYDCSSYCSKDKAEDIWKLFENDVDPDSTEFAVEVAQILYPFLSLEVGSIRGYHDSAEVIYISGSIEDIDVFEDWYYGNIYNIFAYKLDTEALEEDGLDINNLSISEVREYGEEIDGSYPITDTEVYHLTHQGNALAEFASNFGLPVSDCILVDY